MRAHLGNFALWLKQPGMHPVAELGLLGEGGSSDGDNRNAKKFRSF